MQQRKPEDTLREEYFDLLPEIRRVLWQLETEIRYLTLPILHELKSHEQLVIRSRVKECESALKKLGIEKNEGRVLDPAQAANLSILNLPDLAGVRVLVFPNSRLAEVDEVLRKRFDWQSKPVKDDGGTVLAPKYYGYCDNVSDKVRGEYQVVPMLLGLFWDVEHSAMYKFKAVSNFEDMRKHRANVESALSSFEAGIERFIQDFTEPAA